MCVLHFINVPNEFRFLISSLHIICRRYFYSGLARECERKGKKGGEPFLSPILFPSFRIQGNYKIINP